MKWDCLSEGDNVLVHSSLRRTIANSDNFFPGNILISFLQAIGSSGTLLLPTFNFGFTQGQPFDIRMTPSEMGALTNAALKLGIRTGHPIYSFAVLGARKEEFKNLNNFSGYGQDSPFGWLHRNNGKIAILDLDENNSMTAYHYVEECLNVPYREHKTFTASYCDADDKWETRTYGLFVRKGAEGIRTQVNPMGEILWQRGLYRGSRPWVGDGLRVVTFADMFNATAEIILAGKSRGTLYEIGK